MFSLEPFLESRYVVRRIRGSVAVHFINTLATSQRTGHALWLESIAALPDFFLKLLFADHISSVSFCHLPSLPQLSVLEQCSLRPNQALIFPWQVLAAHIAGAKPPQRWKRNCRLGMALSPSPSPTARNQTRIDRFRHRV